MIDLLIAASLSEVLATNYLKKTASNLAGSAGKIVLVGCAAVGVVSLVNSSKKDSK